MSSFWKSVFIVSVISIIFGAVAMDGVRADGAINAEKPVAKPLRYILDGAQYSHVQLVTDFVQIAFQRSLWSDDPLNRARGYLLPDFYSKKTNNAFFSRYPDFLSEYVVREKGYPKFDALNRWPKEITISTGWPPLSAVDEAVTGFSKRVELQVKRLTGDLQSATGLPVRFVDPAAETEDSFARLRIVDGGGGRFYFDNKFKISDRGSSVSAVPLAGGVSADYSKHMGEMEGMFRDAVRFMPFARAQVEGYFVTDKHNNIEFSVCYIWPHHKENLFNALVTECLLRAAGLPELSLSTPDAVLGNWNQSHDPHSKRYILDGKGANLSPLALAMMQSQVERSADAEKIKMLQNMLEDSPSSFPHNMTTSAPQSFTNYDLAVLSILYCTRLTPGMGRFDTLNILIAEERDCFNALSPVRVQ